MINKYNNNAIEMIIRVIVKINVLLVIDNMVFVIAAIDVAVKIVWTLLHNVFKPDGELLMIASNKLFTIN